MTRAPLNVTTGYMEVTSGNIGPATTSRTVDAYFDYASPWSYLAFEIAPRRMPGVNLRWRPIYLRGLEMFATGVPYVGPKLAYIARDLSRCCEHEGVPLNPPAAFPVDGLNALRAAIVAEEKGVFARYHELAFRAVWRDQKDIKQKEVVASILAEALGESANASALIEAFSAPNVKERLKADTAAAAERGVFGVPAFFVGEEMFWGHDRLDYVAREAART